MKPKMLSGAARKESSSQNSISSEILSLFSDDMFVSVENSKEFVGTLRIS